MTKEEILALAELIDINSGGCMFANYDGLEAFIKALVESREELREALSLIEDEMVREGQPVYYFIRNVIRRYLAVDDARMASLGKR